MAKRYTIELLMNLASKIGANPQKFMGTRTNISFLGKGPTKNPLFQGPVAGLEGATEAQLGSKDSIIGAVEDAMGFASARKLNDIQIQALGLNLENILKVYNPPPLPMASVTAIRPGIEGLRRFPKETHKFMGRPLKDKDFSEIDRMIMEGKIPDARGRTWNLKAPGTGSIKAYEAALSGRTGEARGIAREILLQDTRLKLPDEVIESLKLRKDLGKGAPGADPLDLMKKYYGRSMENFDNWLDDGRHMNFESNADAAGSVLGEMILTPQFFAQGGLAGILEV